MLEDLYRATLKAMKPGLVVDIDNTLAQTKTALAKEVQKRFGKLDWHQPHVQAFIEDCLHNEDFLYALSPHPEANLLEKRLGGAALYLSGRSEEDRFVTSCWLAYRGFSAAPLLLCQEQAARFHMSTNDWKAHVLAYLKPKVHYSIDDDPAVARAVAGSSPCIIFGEQPETNVPHAQFAPNWPAVVQLIEQKH